MPRELAQRFHVIEKSYVILLGSCIITSARYMGYRSEHEQSLCGVGKMVLRLDLSYGHTVGSYLIWHVDFPF